MDIVLNLVNGDEQSKTRVHKAKRGGRWTDRLKANRVQKRTSEPKQPLARPAKRRKVEAPEPAKPQRTQIISSLFSKNPKIDRPSDKVQPPSTEPIKPSNAPLDASTFQGLDPLLTYHLQHKMSISKPTAIQRSVLPFLLSDVSADRDRDVFIQSQTGSGKTLAFILPIIQSLLPLSSLSYIDRSIGTLALIIAPTRELASQIHAVLSNILSLRLRPPVSKEKATLEDDEGEREERKTRWLIPGLLTGGSTKSHEKARLRRGCPILVSTPGRLLDHLRTTSAFDVGKLRWLVLDEADRLMDMGFQDTIRGILDALDGRKKLAEKARRESGAGVTWEWEGRRRRTVLCSATLGENVQILAGDTLVDPVMIKPLEIDSVPVNEREEQEEDGFAPPAQLVQKYTIVPLKLRLVTLIALLRSLLSPSTAKEGKKIIVFFSCTDSVDFHFRLFGGTKMGVAEGAVDAEEDEVEEEDERISITSALLPYTSIYRLHGSLPTPLRSSSLHQFSSSSSQRTNTNAILLCTSVASRGLDLPHVTHIVQYDLPTEGGMKEYVHRVGRTARAGGQGEAWVVLGPSEVGWIASVADSRSERRLVRVEGDAVLGRGFGVVGADRDREERATEVQLAFERWVLRSPSNSALARRAFLSHVRAYATHPAEEREIFSVKKLHLGHLAKAFGLRDTPGKVGESRGTSSSKASRKVEKREERPKRTDKNGGSMKGLRGSRDVGDVENRMRTIVRSQGRLTKQGGAMVSSGAGEFQVIGARELDRLVGGRE